MQSYLYTAPKGPPQNFTLSPNSRAIFLSWDPPLFLQRNGVIISYLITCNCSCGSRNISNTSLIIEELEPFTNYTCSISAATVKGNGPVTAKSVMTAEDSKQYTM